LKLIGILIDILKFEGRSLYIEISSYTSSRNC